MFIIHEIIENIKNLGKKTKHWILNYIRSAKKVFNCYFLKFYQNNLKFWIISGFNLFLLLHKTQEKDKLIIFKKDFKKGETHKKLDFNNNELKIFSMNK